MFELEHLEIAKRRGKRSFCGFVCFVDFHQVKFFSTAHDQHDALDFNKVERRRNERFR
jgi:hypothetical protein